MNSHIEYDKDMKHGIKIVVDDNDMIKPYQNLITKEIYKMSEYYWPRWVCSFAEGSHKSFKKEDLIPVKIIYNDKSTVCYFKDGSKEVVHCAEGEEFVKEVGVMSCIMKKLFATRNDFKRLVNAGYVQPEKKTK